MEKKYPQFVTMGNGSALRLVNSGKSYWYYRDGGDWEVDFYERNGHLYSTDDYDNLDNHLLTPITESEWRECNGQYVPDDFHRCGYELVDVKQSNICVEIALPQTNNDKLKYLLIRR
jgi:hypothetical protein